MALTTRTSVKLLAGWASVTTYDDRIDDLITKVGAFIVKWLDRIVEAEVGVVEYPVAYGTGTFRLRNTPVTFTNLTSIYYDVGANFGRGSGDFSSTTLLTEGTDYVLRVDQNDGVTSLCGIVERINGTWAGRLTRERGHLAASTEPRRGHIKVTLSPGWSTVPADIALAANLLIIRVIQMGPRGYVLMNESYAGYSYGLNPPKSGDMLLTPEILDLLLPYKRLD